MIDTRVHKGDGSLAASQRYALARCRTRLPEVLFHQISVAIRYAQELTEALLSLGAISSRGA
jgi:hypothetical protein